jgi:hypothetical protein
MDLEVLIDDLLLAAVPACGVVPADRKHILSLANDFEAGEWRYSKFQNLIWDNIALTCLSARERASLVGQSHSELVTAARNLRLTDKPNDPSEGSELAEILLYGVMHHHFGALPVVPKIFYKQNAQDPAKGADSVHIVLSEGGGFTLWLGEAKFYSSIENARLGPIAKSVEAALRPDKLRKETSIVTNVSDLDTLGISPARLVADIKDALSPKASIDTLKPRLHIPILLLHECALTAAAGEMSAEYRASVISHHEERATAYFAKQVEALKAVAHYDLITFHVILVPVPDKNRVVTSFLENVSHFRSQ